VGRKMANQGSHKNVIDATDIRECSCRAGGWLMGPSTHTVYATTALCAAYEECQETLQSVILQSVLRSTVYSAGA